MTNPPVCTIILVQMIAKDYKKINISIKLGFGSAPVYQQIVEKIISQVVAGELTSSDRLPPVRELAKILNINPNTVAKAYKELAERGVIVSNKGGGTVFAEPPTKKMSKESVENKTKNICDNVIREAAGSNIDLKTIIERLKSIQEGL